MCRSKLVDMVGGVILGVGLALPGASDANPVVLVADGRPLSCVVVAPEVLALASNDTRNAELRLLRDAADDLVTYFRKLSGAEVLLTDKPVAGKVPIYVGWASHA